MERKTVPFGDRKLTIEVLDKGYCAYYIESDDGQSIKLGTREFAKFKQKTTETLGNFTVQKLSVFKNVRVFHIINLMGPHAALGASPLGKDGVDVYWLDKNFEHRCIARLDKQDVTKFIVAIEGMDDD
ncbi:MAG: hypothetical protein FWG65_10845 [Turicibacter sp.]|nr:hypothetical protein [Turicibacter sp.]